MYLYGYILDDNVLFYDSMDDFVDSRWNQSAANVAHTSIVKR